MTSGEKKRIEAFRTMLPSEAIKSVLKRKTYEWVLDKIVCRLMSRRNTAERKMRFF